MESFSNARASLRLLRMAAETGRSLAALHVSRARTGGCPHEAARHGNAWARRLIRALGVEVTVRGAPLPGPHLLLGNHRSYIDILAVLGVTPCAFLAKAEIARWPLLGAAAQLHPTVFVTRDDRDSRKRAREGALGYCRRGFRGDSGSHDLPRLGRPALFPGLVQLAEQYGFPIVPFALEYEDRADAWVDDDPFVGHFMRTFRKPAVRLHLSFGPTLRGGSGETLRRDAADWTRAEVRATARALRTH
jgi:1-acyl-sn-glycerol-3-phosphate acyltransferase